MSTTKIDHGLELGRNLDYGGSLGLVANACEVHT